MGYVKNHQSRTEDHNGGADGAIDHNSKAESHRCRAGRTEDLHGRADRAGAHQSGADMAEDLHGRADGGLKIMLLQAYCA